MGLAMDSLPSRKATSSFSDTCYRRSTSVISSLKTAPATLFGLQLGCKFAALKEELTIGFLHTSPSGNLGPYPDSEEEKVTTIRRAKFFKSTYFQEIFFGFLVVISCGLLWLLMYWFPWWLIHLQYHEVGADDDSAEIVLLEALDGRTEIQSIKRIHMIRDEKGTEQQSFCLNVWEWLFPKKMRGESAPLLDNLPNKTPEVRFIEWRHIRLWFSPVTKAWHRIKFDASQGDFEFVHLAGEKLAMTCETNLDFLHQTYGKNTIQVEVQPFFQILLLQFLSPFFIFQVYSVAVWIYLDYISYSLVLVCMTVGTLMYSSWEIQKAQESLQTLAHSEGVVQKACFTSEGWVYNPTYSAQLVPGNIVMVTNGMVCPCDFVLLSGQCIVNESMLTGETVPVIKESLPLQGRDFNPQTNSSQKHVLLSGSSVMVAKKSSPPPHTTEAPPSIWDLSPESTPVLAMVLQTGSETAKGKLISTLQYPQDSRGFSHNQKEEAYKFVGLLVALTILACSWYILFGIKYEHEDPRLVYLGALNLTTVTIPAALPMVLSIGVAFAFENLKRKGIFASSTTHIVTAGHVDCVCYDKTGTLTTEGDTFVGVYSAEQNGSEACFLPMTKSASDLPEESMFRYILAGCHSLTTFTKEGSEKPELIGEQLEIEMFNASAWVYHEVPSPPEGQPKEVKGRTVPSYCTTAFFPPNEGSTFLAALRIFSFDADLRTMSTIVQAFKPTDLLATDQFLLVKGAPESIKTRCLPTSLPPDFDSLLKSLSEEGFRVLGCGYKNLENNIEKIQQESRANLEKDLTFCGLLVMGNQLKPQTKAILKQVKEAEVRQCMVTGDNILTALAVARQCDDTFITHPTGPTYVVDFPGFDDEEEREFSLLDFEFKYLPREVEDPAQHVFGTFEHLLKAVECGECDFTLALSGNAVVALVNMHAYDRPKDFAQDGIKTRIRRFSSASSMIESVKTVTTYFTVEHKFTALELILSVANVYARCKPQEKQLLVSALQKLSGHYVCMVGDGANDSFALKTADIGLSISSNTQLTADTDHAEMSDRDQVSAAPSIAAPFSTSTSNITPAKELICEGRAALASTMVGFRHMLHYGLLDLSMLIVLAYYRMQFYGRFWLIGDLFVNLPLVLVLNTTACSNTLVKGLPETSIMSKRFFYGLLGHFLLFVLTQVLVVIYVRHQPWYIDYSNTEAQSGFQFGATNTLEVTVIFWVQISQYLISGISLSHNYAGFRSDCWTNKLFMTVLTFLVIEVCLLILCNRYDFVRFVLNTVYMPESFCWCFIGFMVFVCVVHCLFESTVPHRSRPLYSSLLRFQEKNKRKKTKTLNKAAQHNSNVVESIV